MHDIQMRSIQQWAAMMNKWGIQYKLVLPDGQEFGTLEVVKPKSKGRRASPFPVNTLRDYFLPFIGTLQAGDVVTVPFSQFEGERLRGAISAWAITHWGKGTCTTYLNHDAGHVEVLRTN
jgi:hypothetical protein